MLMLRRFNLIFVALAAYSSEHVGEAIDGLRLSRKTISVDTVRAILEKRVLIAARLATVPTDADVVAMARVAVACTPKPDKFQERLARCIARKGWNPRQEAVARRKVWPHKREPPTIVGWDRLPSSDWWEVGL